MKLALVGVATIMVVAQVETQLLANIAVIIEQVNNAKTTWNAGYNFPSETSYDYFKTLMGTLLDSKGPVLKARPYSTGSKIPDEFDARKRWPKCPTISHILDQGNCGSCWAVAGASAFSDRKCIASKGVFTTPLSVQELVSCCKDCGLGCFGGYPSAAWDYFVSDGLVTGGDYNSLVGCQPYEIPPCDHHAPGNKSQCSNLPPRDTPKCHSECTNRNYRRSFKNDIHKASSSYYLDSIQSAQEDIMKYGPLEASFTVYDDFTTYKSGVYQHVAGREVGGHAVRVIGWGIEKGTPYWLAANSWNINWGENGLFKIRRETNECGFEDGLVAGQI